MIHDTIRYDTIRWVAGMPLSLATHRAGPPNYSGPPRRSRLPAFSVFWYVLLNVEVCEQCLGEVLIQHACEQCLRKVLKRFNSVWVRC